MTTTSDQNAAAPPRFDGLRALFINATLKRSPELSHTDGLIDNPPALSRQRRLEVLHPETRQPIPMLHNDHSRIGVRQDAPQLGSLAVQAGTDLAHHLPHPQVTLGGPRG